MTHPKILECERTGDNSVFPPETEPREDPYEYEDIRKGKVIDDT